MRRHTLSVLVLAFALVLSFSLFAAAKSNLALTGTATVDSAFSGYRASVINDGELNDTDETGRWADAAWASAEIPGGHWAEIALAKESSVSGVSIYWARDLGKFWMSSKVVVQYWNGEAWADIYTFSSDRETYDIPVTEITFAPVKTSKIRLVQPEGGGPIKRPNLMWVAEVQVWGE